MEVKRICGKCGEINKINRNTMVEEDLWDEDNKLYKVKYYVCERCKEVHVLQIDDVETWKLYKRFKALMLTVMKNRIHGVMPTKRQINKKNKYVEQLALDRKNLNEVSKGKTLHDKDGKIIIKALTVESEDDIIESNL